MSSKPKKGTKEDTMDVDKQDKTKGNSVNEAEDEETETDFPKLMKENLTTILRAVELDDKNLIRRVWRRNTALRKNLPLIELPDILSETFPKGQLVNSLFEYLDIAVKHFLKQEAGKEAAKKAEKGTKAKSVREVMEEPIMEVESYLTLFIISSLMKYGLYTEALGCCSMLLERLKNVKRQTLDSFAAKAYYLYSLSSEKLYLQGSQAAKSSKNSKAPQVSQTSHYAEELLSELVAGHKTADLRLYEQCQATTANLILRKYISDKMYTQARMFLSHTDASSILDSSHVSNKQQVRYLYYTGKVAAVEANYALSDKHITRAIRKSPTNPGIALGFRLTIQKLNIVTKLLMGEIPERSLFYMSELKTELQPYFYLVQSVKDGSVAEFEKIRQKYAPIFERDDLMTLIDRLKSSVIKTGLRNINLAYSKISFKDIKEKLELKTEKDAELICAKAIRDQIIDNAIIDPKTKTLLSTETVDVYSTTLEPKEHFKDRTDYCLGVYNAAMKAHKYPPNSHKPRKEADAKGEDGEEMVDLFDDFLDDM